MPKKMYLTLAEVQQGCRNIVGQWRAEARGHGGSIARGPKVFGVPRGGVPVAMMVAAMANGQVVDTVEQADIIVDDIVDSGKTKERYSCHGLPFYALVERGKLADKVWIVFPWEGVEDTADSSTDDIGTRLLQAIGEDPERGGLKETPQRFINYMRECTSGMGQDPKALLKVFEDGAENVDEMVVVAGIPFYSMCEHHMAPFFGQAHIAYIPGTTYHRETSTGNIQEDITTAEKRTRIVGLSKIPRLLDLFAKRLQVQERITNQVADVLYKELGALGVGVVLRARHLCMEMRGVKKPGAITYTSALRGVIKDKPDPRSEFLRFVEMADSRMGGL